MNAKLKMLIRNERGITALETAIILIAFVVVASVFAFTILSAGTFSTERSKEAIYAGIAEVRGTMVLKGSVLAGGVAGEAVHYITFTVSNAAGGEAIDLAPKYDSSAITNVVSMDYRDAEMSKANLLWTVTWITRQADDTDQLLEDGELAEIHLNLSASGADSNDITGIDANHKFALEIKPPSGAVILLERTAPAYIDAVMDLK